jgi:hypothetical protein
MHEAHVRPASNECLHLDCPKFRFASIFTLNNYREITLSYKIHITVIYERILKGFDVPKLALLHLTGYYVILAMGNQCLNCRGVVAVVCSTPPKQDALGYQFQLCC